MNKEQNTDTWSIKEVADALEEHGLIREQQPCEDAISRQIISDYVESHIQEINTGYGDLNEHTNRILRMIVGYIESMPSVNSQPKTGQRLCRTCIYGDKTEYDKPCIIYSDNCQLYRADDVLDKIRAEIVAYDDLIGHNAQIQWCLKVIDKYRESEAKR